MIGASLHNTGGVFRSRLPALLCLLGCVLFYLQLAAVAVAMAAGACCAGDSCPVAGHHHHQQKAQDKRELDGGMHCEHGHASGTEKMNSCSMSCCRTTDQFASHSQVYLFPLLLLFFATAPGLPAISIHDLNADSLVLSPASPPPETAPPQA
jgi:hypothetical protein